MPKSTKSTGRIQKRKPKKKKQRQVRLAVSRMLRVMETPGDGPNDAVSEFLGTGRTGRRNAMPDILGQNAQTSCGDLPDRLESLCNLATEPGPSQGGSGSSTSEPNRSSSSNPPNSAPSRPTATNASETGR